MGRYLEAVKVVLVVTLINCSWKFSASNGQTATEKEKTELERKLECIRQKIATCGISDGQTECKEYSEQIQKLTADIEDEDMDEKQKAHDDLLEFAPNATHMCTPALGLHCDSERKKCAKFCNGDDYDDDLEVIGGWTTDYKCAEFGEGYEKCALPEFPDQPSTTEEVKELKCLYKKIVTCGITENKKVCKILPSGDKYKLREMAEKVAGLSPEDIRTKHYPTNCDITEGIKMLSDLSWGSSDFRCSMSKGLYCTNEKKCEPAGGCYEDYCKGVQKIASLSDWEDDYGCGDIACPDISQVNEHSSLEDMKKMKCMYKKFVTCGKADNQTECNPYRLTALEFLAGKIADKSLKDLKSTFTSDKEAKEKIKELEGWLKDDSAGICSIAEGLYCSNSKKRCSKSCGKYGDDTCKPVAKIAAASDWKEDYDCGDSANCHGPITTTDGSEKSGTGRLEVVNCRAFPASLFFAVLVAPY